MRRVDRSGARLLIVEEALKDHHGHWFSYARQVAALSQAEGVSVEAAVHADVSRDLEWEVPVHPVFRTSYWDGSYPARRQPGRQRRRVLRANRRFHRELDALLAGNERYDLVFAPSVIVHQLLAWFFLLLRHGRSKIGCAVLLLRMGPTEPNDIAGDPICAWNARFLGRCLRLFRPLHWAGRVRFATDSEALAREYRELCGLPFSVFPSPVHLSAENARPERVRGETLRIGVLGTATYIKGVDVVLEAIRLLKDDPPGVPVHFVIQWPKGDALAVDREPLGPDEELAEQGFVEYIRRDVPVGEYDALLRSCDCVLLPYRVDPYRLRTSGVLVEAVTRGIPVIVTAGTTLEEGMHTTGAGLVVKDGDPRDLADRIREFAADAEKHRARARERIAAAHAHHSPERFLALLWGDATPERSAGRRSR